MIGLQNSAAQATPEQREKLAALKADPELKIVFDDIEQHGPGEFPVIWQICAAGLQEVLKCLRLIELSANTTAIPRDLPSLLAYEHCNYADP